MNTTFANTHSVLANSKAEALEVLETDNRFHYNISGIKSTKDLFVNDDLSMNFSGSKHSITMNGFNNYMNILGIPNAFARKIPNDLLVSNVTRLISQFERPIKVVTRVSDNAIVNVIHDTYNPIHTKDIIAKIGEEFIKNDMDKKTIHPSIISTEGNFLYFDKNVEGMDIEPSIGDIIKIGKSLFNSEIGGTLYAQVMLYRLICSNGAIMTKDWGYIRNNQNNNFNVLDYESRVDNFINQYNTILPNLDKLNETFKVMQNENIRDTDYVNVFNSVTNVILNKQFKPYSVEFSDEHNVVDEVNNILEIKDIDFEEVKSVINIRNAKFHSDPSEKPNSKTLPVTYYDFYNKVTAAPHKFRRDGQRTNALETIGGGIINNIYRNISEFTKN